MDLVWLKLFVLPVISALIGYITNVIAVRMIFRPRKKINFLGFEIQGLIPKRRHELAVKIGEIVEKELISHKDIQNIIKSDEMTARIRESLLLKIDDLIKQVLGGFGPLVASFISDDMMNSIKNKISDMILGMLPEFIDDLLNKMEKNINFKEMVINKIENFELEKLENIVLSISKKELKHIEVLGAVLGFIIGLIQMLIIWGTMVL